MKKIFTILLGFNLSLFLSCGPDPVDTKEELTTQVEEIGSSEVELLDTGEGGQTFVFIHDIGGELDEWIRSNIARQLASSNQVIAYNRHGYGASAATSDSATLLKVTEALHELITARAQNDQVVLVGHAWGATIARVYATRYPEMVAASLLLDSIHEGQFAEDEDRALPFWYFDRVSPASQKEIDAFTGNMLLLDTLASLPDKPVTLITAFGPVATLDRRFAAQASLIDGLSSGGVKHFTLDQIGYQIHLESPDVVIQELFSLIQKIR